MEALTKDFAHYLWSKYISQREQYLPDSINEEEKFVEWTTSEWNVFARCGEGYVGATEIEPKRHASVHVAVFERVTPKHAAQVKIFFDALIHGFSLVRLDGVIPISNNETLVRTATRRFGFKLLTILPKEEIVGGEYRDCMLLIKEVRNGFSI